MLLVIESEHHEVVALCPDSRDGRVIRIQVGLVHCETVVQLVISKLCVAPRNGFEIHVLEQSLAVLPIVKFAVVSQDVVLRCFLPK